MTCYYQGCTSKGTTKEHSERCRASRSPLLPMNRNWDFRAFQMRDNCSRSKPNGSFRNSRKDLTQRGMRLN